MAVHLRRIRPTPSPIDQANPHRGFCTFFAFNGDPLFSSVQLAREGPIQPTPAVSLSPGYLHSVVAYFRWEWRDLAPRKGVFDFSALERVLEEAPRRGQTVLIRVMPLGRPPISVPAWYAAEYPTEKSGEMVHPIYDSPEYLEHFGGLMRELGRRFDNHPAFEGIDLSYFGNFGTCEPKGVISLETCQRFAALFKEAFPHSFRFALSPSKSLEAGVATGTGWRIDGFGDLRNLGSDVVSKSASFNHMYDKYPREIIEGGAVDTWKTAPVLLESIYSPQYWYENRFDIDFILEQGLKYHASYFNPKSVPIPEKWFDKFDAFERKLGYNFVLRQAAYIGSVKPGELLRFFAWIENIGVAPLYHHYDFALRLRQGDRVEILALDGIDVRTWLPGDICIDREIPVPPDFKPGIADISAGIIDSEAMVPKVSFSIKENYRDRWAALGFVEIAQ